MRFKVTQLYVGAVFQGEKSFDSIPAKFSRSFLPGKDIYMMLGCTLSPQWLLQQYAKMSE